MTNEFLTPSIVLNTFINGLQKASKGILRVESISQPELPEIYNFTGWLITDRLVIIPFAPIEASMVGYRDMLPWRCRCYSHNPLTSTNFIEARFVCHLPTNIDNVRPALLRLDYPSPQAALTLGSDSVRLGELIFVLYSLNRDSEIRMSMGQLSYIEDLMLHYNTAIEVGSTGGPIFNSNWELIGMHVGRSFKPPMSTTNENQLLYNGGLAISAILKGLRKTPVWNEVMLYHHLADVAGVQQRLESLNLISKNINESLLSFAVRWQIDPTDLPSAITEQLRTLVNNPSSPIWTMRSSDRQRLIREAGSLDILRKARGNDRIDDPRQQVVDRILQGPPYDLESIDEILLPYWLQSVRWFIDVVPSLPTPRQINQTLERRRIRSRLELSVGAEFRGRRRELAMLRNWYDQSTPQPMIITGVGGIGKSALVAKFALGLDINTLLLWLDFDRADLAPDDGLSVLRLLSEQATVQLDGTEPPRVDSDSWQENIALFSGWLSTMLNSVPAPLLVLDGFEIAQYFKQHHEIWELLHLILSRVPELRIIVSGRAPVSNLKLGDRPPHYLHLVGIGTKDVRSWLQAHAITDKTVLQRVIHISRGVPLVLKLAVRLVEEGGNIQDLPRKLPNALIEGYLYQRILDRVIDPVLKPVVWDALVLRRVTAEILSEVLGDKLPANLESQEVFSRLTQEMGLVEIDSSFIGIYSTSLAEDTKEVLRIRPEVRSATLRLLELDNLNRVREIDQRAVDWYSRQDLNDDANAAEFIYHCLRLDNVALAETVWRDDCASLLLHSLEELPESALNARSWLRAHTSLTIDLAAWEASAVARIRDAMARTLFRAIPDILNEHKDRSKESPLIIYDAWAMWFEGNMTGALNILKNAPATLGLVGRDRAIIGAWFASQEGHLQEADRLLAQIESKEYWENKIQTDLELLAVRAARIRCNVDILAEIELLNLFQDAKTHYELRDVLKNLLTPSDVVLHPLSECIDYEQQFMNRHRPIPIPIEHSLLSLFAQQLDREKSLLGVEIHPAFRLDPHAVIETPLEDWQPSSNEDNMLFGITKRSLKHGADIGLWLAFLGWRRWRLVTTSLFFAQACEQFLLNEKTKDPLLVSIVGTFVSLRNPALTFLSPNWDTPLIELDDIIKRVFYNYNTFPISRSKERIELVKLAIPYYSQVNKLNIDVDKWIENLSHSKLYSLKRIFTISEDPQLRSLLLYLLGPDPLEILFNRVLGLPNFFEGET